MIRREGEYPTEVRQQYRGAPGSVQVEQLLAPPEYADKGRLFVRCTLEPGSGVGYHIHHGELEIFYILSGEAQIDNGSEVFSLLPGDTLLTKDGEGHSILAVGETPLVYIAVVLFTNP